jgi:two-component sensor histidine kinase
MNAYNTNQNVRLTQQIEPFDLDINYAVPCGLIINELTTNALKHAFPGKRSGNIIIRCKKRNNTVELEIRDNGIGIPDNIPLQSKKSMGMTLVNILTEQINGSISIRREKETSIKITFDIAS